MNQLQKLWRGLRYASSDEGFRQGISGFETLIAKLLAIGMVVVILVSVWDLGRILLEEVLLSPRSFLNKELLEIFGFFLTVLIALELLQNIGAYLQRHSVQLELVVATSLTAVARKIILLDLAKVTGLQLVGLGVAVLTLSISYWLVRSSNRRH